MNLAGTLIQENWSDLDYAQTPNAWTRRVLENIVAPATAVNVSIRLYVYSQASSVAATVWMHAAQFEEGQSATPYCDGDQPGCRWLGVAHNSVSVRDAVAYQHPRGKLGFVQLLPSLWVARKDGTLVEDITAYVLDGSVEMDYTRAIKMTCRFLLTEDVVEPYADYLAPNYRIVYGDGTEETHQVGVFVTEPGRKTITPSGIRVELAGSDPTYWLTEKRISGTYRVPAGTNYVERVRKILNDHGLVRHNIASASAVAPTGGVMWKAGTQLLTIVNDLLTGSGLYQIWADRFGVLTSHAYIAVRDREPVKRYTGGDEDPGTLTPFVTELTEKPYNDVIVYRELNDGTVIKGRARNTNAASPTSIQRIGSHTRFVEARTITLQATADAYARSYLEESALLTTRATLETLPEPWHDVHERYELALTDTAGAPISEATGIFWPTAWKIGFGPKNARMVHTMKRLSPLDEV